MRAGGHDGAEGDADDDNDGADNVVPEEGDLGERRDPGH